MTPVESLQHIIQMRPFSRQEAWEVMDQLLSGTWTDCQIASLLTGLRMGVFTGETLAGFAMRIREELPAPPVQFEVLVDTCGTGGGPSTLNLSTGAAILAAASGAKVAKHGNRAVSSHCGSADVLEALGISLEVDPYRTLESLGIGFFFAPMHHAALAKVGPIRKQLGFRTIFNLLGPLLNPAGANRQLVGVYETSLIRPMTEALNLLGTEHAWVVHAEDGLDEVSPSAITHVGYATPEGTRYFKLSHHDFDQFELPQEAYLARETVEENAELLEQAISGTNEQALLALIPDAASALFLAGIAESLPLGAGIAISAAKSGKALELLNQWRAVRP